MSIAIDLDPKEYTSVLEVLRKIDFFEGVSEETLNSLLFSIQKESVAPKKVILFQGEIANRLCIIRKGNVEITTKNKGSRLVLAELASPAYFGEISLLRPVSATATVTAGDQGADLLIISHEAMKQLTKKIPDLTKRIETIIETRLASKKKAKDTDESS